MKLETSKQDLSLSTSVISIDFHQKARPIEVCETLWSGLDEPRLDPYEISRALQLFDAECLGIMSDGGGRPGFNEVRASKFLQLNLQTFK